MFSKASRLTCKNLLKSNKNYCLLTNYYSTTRINFSINNCSKINNVENNDDKNNSENKHGIREMFKLTPALTRTSTLVEHLNNNNQNQYDFNLKVNEIKLRKKRKVLELHFSNDEIISLSAELLRVESPSVEVQGVGGQKKLLFGKKFIEISNIETVGHYGVRLIFSDGHDTGIYSWKYLYDMGKHRFTLMKSYIKDLKISGKSRYPRSYLKQQELAKKKEDN
ncbi:hypothetical protein ABK040_010432 [Willaertia magna]